MATRTFDVDRMQPAERSAVVGGLARAFYDDPLFGYFMPDPIVQSKGLLTFMGAGVADAAPFGEIWVARDRRARSRARRSGSRPARTRAALGANS